MGRQQGNLPFSSNFETRFAEPLDARARVELQSDLTAAATWERDGNPSYTYVGMPVSVYADPDPEKNGLYLLMAEDFSDIGNWVMLGGGVDPRGDVSLVLSESVAAENLSGHRAVTKNSAGLVIYASAEEPGHVDGVIGVTTAAANEGAEVTFATHGELITEGSWTWTPGGPIYLRTDGQLSQTPPSIGFVCIVGNALTAETMLVMPRISVELAEPMM